jgi:hypothetical protein
MLKMILELISNAIGTVSNWFKWKSSGVAQRESAEDIVQKSEDAAAKRKAEINRACHEGDADAVNRIVNGCGMAFLFAAFLLADAYFMCGCFSAPKPQYVAADREVTCVTNAAGMVEYWKVPPLIMEELLNAKLELGELKKENKVKEITK